jgi:hypothetical protein
MSKPRLLFCLAALLALALPYASREALAQSSLWTAPTGESLPESETYLEFDFDAHPTSYKKGGFQSYGVFLVRGVGKGVEVGVNAYFLKDGDGETQPLELQPNIKWQFYNSKDKSLSAAVGGILFAPVGRGGDDTVGMLYASATKTVEAMNGAQLTGGGYGLVGRNGEGGSRAGALVGYFQPVTRKLCFMADWNSGRNRFGYGAAGFGLDVSKKGTLYSGYYFGNEGRANNFFGVYYGHRFTPPPAAPAAEREASDDEEEGPCG